MYGYIASNGFHRPEVITPNILMYSVQISICSATTDNYRSPTYYRIFIYQNSQIDGMEDSSGNVFFVLVQRGINCLY